VRIPNRSFSEFRLSRAISSLGPALAPTCNVEAVMSGDHLIHTSIVQSSTVSLKSSSVSSVCLSLNLTECGPSTLYATSVLVVRLLPPAVGAWIRSSLGVGKPGDEKDVVMAPD